MFKMCEPRAKTARSTVEKRLHPHVGAENADEILKAVERVVEILGDLQTE